MTSDVLKDMARYYRRLEVADGERFRVADVREAGRVPAECGPAAPDAPARGPVRVFTPIAHYPDGDDGYVVKPSGFLGRRTMRSADSFDVMEAKAKAANGSPPFTSHQVAIGRRYRDVVERHAAAGAKCSSLEALSGGSSDGGSFIDAVLRDREEIEVLRRRIGAGAAMIVRRQRPSKRGIRITIMDRRLVDIVCLEDGTLTDVLRQHGWAVKADLRDALRRALAEALDRMIGGYRPVRPSVAHF